MHFQMLMLCLKNSLIGNNTIHPELLLMVRIICWNKVALVLVTQKQEALLTINNHLLFDVQTAYSSTREREREREKIC